MDRKTLLAKAIAKQLINRMENPLGTLDIYDAQRNFVFSNDYNAAFIGGISSGKSWAGSLRVLRAAYGRIGKRIIKTPNVGMVTAPTYKILQRATIRTLMELAGGRIVDFNKSEMRTVFNNGSEIFFASTDDPDNLRGPSLSYWFGDEAAMYRSDVWPIMVGRLRQFGVRGSAWLATTPKGRNWVWQEFIRDAVGVAIRAKSSDNVYLDRGVIEAFEQSHHGDFARQELGGEFVAFEGLIYPEFDRDKHVLRIASDKNYSSVIAGVDWGFANPGVIVVIGMDGDGGAHVADLYYERGKRIDDWANLGDQLRNSWGITTFYCDPSEPDNIAKFQEKGLNAVKADNRVNPGIQTVKRYIATNKFKVSPDAVELIAEFDSYQWAKSRDGITDKPLKTGDHAMDALRYALMGANVGGAEVVQSVGRWA